MIEIEKPKYLEIGVYRYDPNGGILVDEDGIALTVRDARDTLTEMFQDELVYTHHEKEMNWFKKTLRLMPKRINYQIWDESDTVVEKQEKPLFTRGQFFTSGSKIVEIGCGDGRATQGLGERYPECEFFGVDRGLANWFSAVEHPKNVQLISMNWRELHFEDQSIDRLLIPYSMMFHDPFSKQAFLEVQRVARVGCLLRGNYAHFNPEVGEVYLRALKEFGWEVYEFERLLLAKKMRHVEIIPELDAMLKKMRIT